MTPVIQAITLMIELLNRAAAISSLVARAQSEGRDLLPEEWQAITDAADQARADLAAAIATAKGS